VRFIDIDEIKAAVADVRSDATNTNWVLLSYAGLNSNDVSLIGKGEGDVDELTQQLTDEIVGYGLVRVIEKFDESNTVKFVFIKWVGERIHRMLRARLGTHSGAINEVIAPYHVDVVAEHKSEISEHIVRDKIRKTSGTASRVLEKQTSSPSSSAPFRGARPGGSPRKIEAAAIPKALGQAESVRFADEAELREAIQDVRNDLTDTNWVLATYEGTNSNTVILLGKGGGGAAELIGLLRDDIVAYGLVREVERFDESDTVKFAFINWVGEGINRMLRARLGTHSGAVKELFRPYHVDISPSLLSEITPELLTQAIRNNMGTASRVREV